jgi:H+/Cl- antiporter ClcA
MGRNAGTMSTGGATSDLDNIVLERNIHRAGHARYRDFLHQAVQKYSNDVDGDSLGRSVIIALCVATASAIGAVIYYKLLEFLLHFLWHSLPQKIVVDTPWVPEWAYALWIPFISYSMATLLGLSVVYIGEPGDLAYTIKCVHQKGFVALDHATPMLTASLFSIAGGGSLGPEAPLVAICAALGGFISQAVFHTRKRNTIRKHTLMGMAGALAAFFGAPLGGSIFALEVNSRFGVEYFEHMIEAVFCGVITLGLYRTFAGKHKQHRRAKNGQFKKKQ